MKKIRKKSLPVFIICLFFAVFALSLYSAGVSPGSREQAEEQQQPEQQPPAEPGTGELTLADVNKIWEEKTVENCEKAIKGYEELIKKDPKNYVLLQKISYALIAIIDIKTNALIVEKDEYKPVLKKLGKLAYDYALKAYAINPKDKEVLSACLVSYGYYSASFGIVKAIFKGAAGKYKKYAKELIKIDEKHEAALGYRSLGKLNDVAPWPVGTSGRALKYFKKAIKIDSSSLFAHYYLGTLYFKKDKFNLAKKEFNMVLTGQPNPGEKHFIASFKEAAQEYLEKIKKEEED
ncbi:MAG: hypothetical protein KAW12_03660 [Candidatus Aminicenantes bacterium]|nr:hypothetical protein [Candidatus Aminicenantes bacterium]